MLNSKEGIETMSSRLRILVLLIAGHAAACAPTPVAHSQSQPRPVAAMVSGQPIYDDEISSSIETQLFDLKRQEYALKIKALDQTIEKKLLAAAGAKGNMTVDALLQAEADSAVLDPTDEEIEIYYQAQKNTLNLPLEQVRGQISQALKQGRVNQARDMYKAMLRRQASID